MTLNKIEKYNVYATGVRPYSTSRFYLPPLDREPEKEKKELFMDRFGVFFINRMSVTWLIIRTHYQT